MILLYFVSVFVDIYLIRMALRRVSYNNPTRFFWYSVIAFVITLFTWNLFAVIQYAYGG